jgi:hypothetical protein
MADVDETEISSFLDKHLEMTGENLSDIYGDFTLCRLKPDRPGHMRLMCVSAAEKLVVQNIGDPGRQFRLLSTWPEMTDDPFDAPGRKPPPPRKPRPGEVRVRARIRSGHFRCELRTHEGWGVEAQFWMNGVLLIGRRLDTRALAVQCAMVGRSGTTSRRVTTSDVDCL